MESMLAQVGKEGWSWKTLYKSASTLKEVNNLEEAELKAIFSNKIANIIRLFNEKLDEEMIKSFVKISKEKSGITQ
jgi:hypothetical protein